MKDLINHHLNNYTAKELSQKTGIPHQIIRAISTGGYVAKKHRDNEGYLEALKEIKNINQDHMFKKINPHYLFIIGYFLVIIIHITLLTLIR